MEPSILDGEPLFPVVRAIEIVTGSRPHKSTSYRWMEAGIGLRRIRLPYVKLGGKRACSVEAVRRWIAAVTAASHSAEAFSGNRAELQAERAEHDLDQAGW
jgi:hypothetical protein